MSKDVDIKKAFLARADALALAMNMPVDMPGTSFEPPNDARYLEVRHFPNTNINYGYTDKTVFQGFFQISVVDPLNEGEIVPSEKCALIVAYFDKGTIIREGEIVVKIEVRPSVLTAIVDGHKSTYPVSIPYRAS